jgi:hypothetical protein|tara:strand:- start:1203 stop:1523 length:321 start_codon:yes stop_codon:yes gene_type:complete
MEDSKRAGTGLGSALEGMVIPPKTRPSKEELAEVGQGAGFRHTQPVTAPKVKRAKRPRVQRMQLNHSVAVEAIELFERIAERNPDTRKGALLEKAIQLLANEQGIK